MKNLTNLTSWTILALAVFVVSQTTRADIVYENDTTRSSPDLFAQSGYEFGDEVIISGGVNRYLTNFTLEYYGTAFSGDETIRLRIYSNDGDPYGTNFSAPGSILYDSGAFLIAGTTGSTLSFDKANSGFSIPVHTNFTWTVEFGGVTGGESAGLALYDPPTVGTSYPDYWEHSGLNNAWSLRNPNMGEPNLNFGALAQAEAAAADTLNPAVSLTFPKDKYRTNNATFTVTGKATDPDGHLALVLFKLGSDSFRPATGTTNWTATITCPKAGTNRFTVKSIDKAGHESIAVSANYFLIVNSALTLRTNGFGGFVKGTGFPVGPIDGASLEIGRPYTITAYPSNNYVFSNYVSTAGGVTNAGLVNAKLTFLMETGQVLTCNFVTNRFISAAGTYYGLFSDSSNGVSHQSAGFISFKTDAKQKFSGKLSVDGDTIGFAGVLNLAGDGISAKPILRKGKSPLTVRVHVDLTGDDQITGSVSNALSWVSEILSDKATFNLTNNPATNYTGAYTMVLPGQPDAAVAPGGDSYNLVTVKTNGTIVGVGFLGDAAALKPTATSVSKNGDWPFYAVAYSDIHPYTNTMSVLVTNKQTYGSVFGWLSLSPNPTRGIGGNLKWTKAAVFNDLKHNGYIGGFSNPVTAILASAYTIPAISNRVVELTNGNGLIIFDKGGLTSPLSNSVTLSVLNKFTIGTTNYGLKATVTPKTGLFSGSFKNPDNTNRVTKFYGAILQEQNVARGFFSPGTNDLSGSVILEGN